MGPTQNAEYNACFADWLAIAQQDGTTPPLPQCEECETDLTGKPVVAGKWGWYCCKPCRRKCEPKPAPGDIFFDEGRWERQQMGFTAL